MLHGLEAGTVHLSAVDAKKFFDTLRKDVQDGFFADPIYGGNRDMCASGCHKLDGSGIPYLIPDLAGSAAVAAYVRNSWGHAAGVVAASAAHTARESGPGSDASAR